MGKTPKNTHHLSKEHEKIPKKITIGRILSWFFGVIWLIAGFTSLSSSFTVGLVYIFMALVLLPPANNFLMKKFNIQLSRGIKILLIIIGLIIIASILAKDNMIEQSSNADEDQSSQVLYIPQKNTQQETKSEVVYSMNQDIAVDYLTYKITSVETPLRIGNDFFNKETTGKFVIVNFEIRNDAKETKQIFTPRFNLQDQFGRKYDRLSDDLIYVDDSIGFGEQLQPGVTKSGSIIFEIPKDSMDLSLVISGDWLSTAKVVVSLKLPEVNSRDQQNAIKEIRLSEEIEIDNIVYLLKGAYERKSVGEYIDYEAKGSYYIIPLIIKNNNKQHIETPEFIIRAIDQDDNEFIEDESGKIYLENAYRTWSSEKINPKSSEEYQLLFDIPPSSRIIYISIKNKEWKDVTELKVEMRQKKSRN